ncbi:type II toxin-antitoxin system RelE family toxin [Salinicoccus kekensis]|uniref:mRNA-degrading endonuclease RelE of RelBE toxin-antitoxin system n=1 Tax=Salinicoccus kekensis TaxID=714307 RepID=A0A285UC66_9STAP|nr:addiction module toxin RelE [Salinicoccus kekensis]SOC39399.1 mRNA-degrading endonuclease RelE of RelBE toxin-antitoxin system [Salinicoccus kekensis]
MYHLHFNVYSEEEYKNLDGSQKKLINKGLRRIQEQGMSAGQELRGELKHCRKLKYKKAGLRIIFRQDGDNIEIIEIVAIGKRSEKEVYKDAENRLN